MLKELWAALAVATPMGDNCGGKMLMQSSIKQFSEGLPSFVQAVYRCLMLVVMICPHCTKMASKASMKYELTWRKFSVVLDYWYSCIAVAIKLLVEALSYPHYIPSSYMYSLQQAWMDGPCECEVQCIHF